jgi:hypothetical protein
MENLNIFRGIKLIARRDHNGQWWEIVQDCVQCGKCCIDAGPGWVFGVGDDLTGCRYLEKEADGKTYRCDLGSYRPIGCCGNSPFSEVEYCSVRFRKIDDPSSLL